MKLRIGVIGDTHGVIHSTAHDFFRGVDQIIHTGDIGGRQVLDDLQIIAPVIAVKGNYDTEPDLQHLVLPDPSRILIGGHVALFTHRMFTMDWDHTKTAIAEMLGQGKDSPRLVIFGHTHFSVMEEIRGIWFVNPGYAGPDPYEAPTTFALVEIRGNEIGGEIIEL